MRTHGVPYLYERDKVVSWTMRKDKKTPEHALCYLFHGTYKIPDLYIIHEKFADLFYKYNIGLCRKRSFKNMALTCNIMKKDMLDKLDIDSTLVRMKRFENMINGFFPITLKYKNIHARVDSIVSTSKGLTSVYVLWVPPLLANQNEIIDISLNYAQIRSKFLYIDHGIKTVNNLLYLPFFDIMLIFPVRMEYPAEIVFELAMRGFSFGGIYPRTNTDLRYKVDVRRLPMDGAIL